MDPKKQKKFAEGPLQTLGKEVICQGQAGGPSAKPDLRQSFAEGLTTGTRQSLTPRAAITLGPHRRAPLLCRGPGPRQRWALTEGVSLPRVRPSAKKPLAKVTRCRGLALGKDVLYRVPEIRPSAKEKTLGSVAVSVVHNHHVHTVSQKIVCMCAYVCFRFSTWLAMPRRVNFQ